MEIGFITPTLERVEEYLEIFKEIAEEGLYLGVTQLSSKERIEHCISNAITNKIPYLFIVDEKHNGIVGWCEVQPITKERGFLSIGLLKAYRDLGIGRRGIENIFVLAKYYGYHALELTVRVSNTRAIHLYKTLGFVEQNYIKDGLTVDSGKDDLIQMKIKI